mmetsp:Transcript_7915/g.24312  ORF Transcript_7915/g.24312 Transcript_7915/m.24312 type:complete len:218 (+) Transcript_7915:2090-2743(+)
MAQQRPGVGVGGHHGEHSVACRRLERAAGEPCGRRSRAKREGEHSKRPRREDGRQCHGGDVRILPLGPAAELVAEQDDGRLAEPDALQKNGRVSRERRERRARAQALGGGGERAEEDGQHQHEMRLDLDYRAFQMEREEDALEEKRKRSGERTRARWHQPRRGVSQQLDRADQHKGGIHHAVLPVVEVLAVDAAVGQHHAVPAARVDVQLAGDAHER